MQIGIAIMENSTDIPQKLTELQYDPAIPLLGM